jgi:hypothetical protein
MQAEDRPIHFSTELIFPAIALKPQVLQRLYYEFSQDSACAYDNVDLGGKKGPPRFFSARGKAQSIALFLPDRAVLVEEWVDVTFETFLAKVAAAGARIIDAFELEAITAQTATVRTTYALTHFEDARVFLLEHVCNQQGRIGPHFRRPILTGGLRFVLPATEDHAGDLHVIIESFRNSRNEVFVEAKGVHRNLSVSAGGLEELTDRLRAVRAFTVENVHTFLQQYDVPPQDPEL